MIFQIYFHIFKVPTLRIHVNMWAEFGCVSLQSMHPSGQSAYPGISQLCTVDIEMKLDEAHS